MYGDGKWIENIIVSQLIQDYVLGCVGLAEKDWVGKYECKYYKEIKGKYKNGKGYNYNQFAITSKK